MIVLFEENETLFTSLGLGVLSDALTASVKETGLTDRTDSLEFTMTYPITGKLYNELKIGRIVYCKINPFDEAQPFRIYSITRPINGIVTVDAVHISYDMNNIPVKPLDGQNLNDILLQIQNLKRDENNKIITYSLLDHKFTFATDVTNTRTYKTTAPFNMRALLMGGKDSILSKYEAEIKFNKFNAYILMRRGADRGAKVVYGHNMTDLNHKTTDENLYNGVYPYYHSEKTSTQTTTEESFKKAYIVSTKEFQDGWLSFSKDGQPYHPVDESPVQIATEGDFYDKVYTWNMTYEMYEERIYNEQITLIQGVTESTWIRIDWSNFLQGGMVRCVANKPGYFKTTNDTTWGEKKGVGDLIFEGSILNSGIIQNMILYYSEVIPTSGSSENQEVSEVIHVELDPPIMKLDTPDAKTLLHDKILILDLTNEIDGDDEPSQDILRAKAEEYIKKNKIGYLKHSTSVSFIDISRTTEADKYHNFDHIEYGDDVKVIYEDMGVNVTLRVIETEYDPISDKYTKIELGEVEKKLSTSSVQTGDNVSSLTNDIGYASQTEVRKLIAEQITAEYLEAVNAKLSEAQIKQLEVERINCTGIFEASQFTLDKLVAKMLVAEDAEIRNTLTAGHLAIKGDIDVTSGQINIFGEEGGTYFSVDRSGNVIANSVSITGGELDIAGNFRVENNGTMYAANAEIYGHVEATSGVIGGCEIINGVLKVSSVNVESIYVEESENVPLFEVDAMEAYVYIAGFTARANSLYNGYLVSGEIESFTDNEHDGVYIGTDGIRLGKYFTVDDEGTLNASNVNITGGKLSIGGSVYNPNFEVTTDGIVTAKDINITGGTMHFGGLDAETATFTVDEYGNVKAKNLRLLGGELKGDSNSTSPLTIDFDNFKVDKYGNIKANDADLTGKITATDGSFCAAYSRYMIKNNIILYPGQQIDISINVNASSPWLPEDLFGMLPSGTYVFETSKEPIYKYIGATYIQLRYRCKSVPSAYFNHNPSRPLPCLYVDLKINPETGEMMQTGTTSGTFGQIELQDGAIGYSGSFNYNISNILNYFFLNVGGQYGLQYKSSEMLIVNGNLKGVMYNVNNNREIKTTDILEICTLDPDNPYLRVRGNDGTNYRNVTIYKNDIEINGTSISDSLKPKIWGKTAQWNTDGHICTLEYDYFDLDNVYSIVTNVQTDMDNIDNPCIIKSFKVVGRGINKKLKLTVYNADYNIDHKESGEYTTFVHVIVYGSQN